MPLRDPEGAPLTARSSSPRLRICRPRSVSGEHGDGRARGELLRFMYPLRCSTCSRALATGLRPRQPLPDPALAPHGRRLARPGAGFCSAQRGSRRLVANGACHRLDRIATTHATSPRPAPPMARSSPTMRAANDSRRRLTCSALLAHSASGPCRWRARTTARRPASTSTRGVRRRAPHARRRRLRVHHDGGDFTAAVHRCTGGVSRRSLRPSMPSHLASRDEKDVTRGRAPASPGKPRTLAAVKAIDFPKSSQPRPVPGLQGPAPPTAPAGVDMARYRSEASSAPTGTHAPPSAITRSAGCASPASPLGRARPGAHRERRQRRSLLRSLATFRVTVLAEACPPSSPAPSLRSCRNLLAGSVPAFVSSDPVFRYPRCGGTTGLVRPCPRAAAATTSSDLPSPRCPRAKRPLPAGDGLPILSVAHATSGRRMRSAGPSQTLTMSARVADVLEANGLVHRRLDACCGLTWITTVSRRREEHLMSLASVPQPFAAGIPPSALSLRARQYDDPLDRCPSDPRWRSWPGATRTLAEVLSVVPRVRAPPAEPGGRDRRAAALPPLPVMGWDTDQALLESLGARDQFEVAAAWPGR